MSVITIKIDTSYFADRLGEREAGWCLKASSATPKATLSGI